VDRPPDTRAFGATSTSALSVVIGDRHRRRRARPRRANLEHARRRPALAQALPH
jgi:hypothetical protein